MNKNRIQWNKCFISILQCSWLVLPTLSNLPNFTTTLPKSETRKNFQILKLNESPVPRPHRAKDCFLGKAGGEAEFLPVWKSIPIEVEIASQAILSTY
ncbi:hypothetical protein DPMN_042618 [Dreissena polymorpha]|uniref:Uncharacterized protein n=1 Tax=Dreissena polymorpha TaxID=45954 RepID=A0A9D4HX70_DREPO|nr:hypothetical protein DPMN_042618 [Dreissena polymorpha]